MVVIVFRKGQFRGRRILRHWVYDPPLCMESTSDPDRSLPIGDEKFQRLRDDNKNKIFAVLRGVGRGGREDNCPKTLFFLGKATTIKFSLSALTTEIDAFLLS